MGLMTLQGAMSLRCGWYSTTTMEAGVHRQAPQVALALPSLSHVTAFSTSTHLTHHFATSSNTRDMRPTN
jgi:hypothetical protein